MIDEFSALLNRTKRLKEPVGSCFFVDASGVRCRNRTISSHSLQRSRILKGIAELGQVYGFDGPRTPDGPPISPRLIGVSKASTFPGYCKRHDKELFSHIEDGNFSMDEKSVLLICLRAVAREIFTKSAQIRMFNDPQLRTKIISASGRESYDKLMYGTALGRFDLERTKVALENAIQTGSIGNLEYASYEIEEQLPFAFTGSFPPEYDLSGAPIAPNADDQWGVCVTFCGTLDKKSIFLLCALDAPESKQATLFLQSLKNFSGNMGDLALNLGLEYVENVFFRPSWLNAQSDALRTAIIRKVYSGITPDFPHRPESLFELTDIVNAHVAGGLASG